MPEGAGEAGFGTWNQQLPKAGAGSPGCWATGDQPAAGGSSHEFAACAFHRIWDEVVWWVPAAGFLE